MKPIRSLSRSLLAVAAPLALLAVGGCTEPFNARVARFQRLPAPQGQTFTIQPVRPQDRGGLEFATYANLVSQHLAQQGYRPIAGGGPADMIVQIDYGVGPGQQKVTTTPGIDCGFGGFGGWGGCPDVESYTVYSSYLSMNITRADGTKLFEGKARAHSTTDALTVLVPNLIDAMFTGFPGNSGQDIRISISPQQQKARQQQQMYTPQPPAGGPTS